VRLQKARENKNDLFLNLALETTNKTAESLINPTPLKRIPLRLHSKARTSHVLVDLEYV
jgi:hypothetical protein